MLKRIQTVPGKGESTFLALSGTSPVAKGGQRFVYQHPGDSRLLVKVPRKASQMRAPWYKKLRSRYAPIRREMAQHKVLGIAAPADLDLIERVAGLVKTDLGYGLVVEALRSRSGELAPNFRDLAIQGKIDARLREKLEKFLRRVIDSSLVAHDFKIKNFVLAYDPASDSERVVLVDGIGGRPDLSIDWISERLSRFNKARRAKKLWAELSKYGQ